MQDDIGTPRPKMKMIHADGGQTVLEDDGRNHLTISHAGHVFLPQRQLYSCCSGWLFQTEIIHAIKYYCKQSN